MTVHAPIFPRKRSAARGRSSPRSTGSGTSIGTDPRYQATWEEAMSRAAARLRAIEVALSPVDASANPAKGVRWG
jgi:hypothetical protein